MNKKYTKILMAVPYFLLWILYFFITIEERNRYSIGKMKGIDCIVSKDVSKFLYGTTTEYIFDPNSKPQRRYTTWKEFWKLKGY